MGIFRAILRILGVPTEEQIAAAVSDASDLAKAEGFAQGREAGRAEAAVEFESQLESLAEKHSDEIARLRKGLLDQDELKRQDARVKERISTLRTLEKKASAASDGISAREVRLITDYAKKLDEEYRLNACEICDSLLESAQVQGWKLSAFKQDFLNNISYFDENVGDSRGYKLLGWIVQEFAEAQDRTLKDASNLLRYFRALANAKGGTEDVAAKIDKCVTDPKYYNLLKSRAQKKVQELEALHATYVQELDELSRTLLEERGAKGSFETMIEESRRADGRIVLGTGGVASRITRLREMQTYEKDHNINLYDYINQEAL